MFSSPDHHFYDESKPFTCLDGTATIPFDQVNDDYCDCKDGSDEPGELSRLFFEPAKSRCPLRTRSHPPVASCSVSGSRHRNEIPVDLD